MTPVSVNVGDKVMLPEYGGTKVILEDEVMVSVQKLKVHGRSALQKFRKKSED